MAATINIYYDSSSISSIYWEKHRINGYDFGHGNLSNQVSDNNASNTSTFYIYVEATPKTGFLNPKYKGYGSGSIPHIFYYSAGTTKTYTIYASIAITVTFENNGGTGGPTSQTAEKNVTFKLATTKPTRTNHTFLGWSTSSTATYATYQPGGDFSSSVDITLYAVWQRTQCHVHYHGNGGSFEVSGTITDTIIKIYNNGTTQTIIDDIPARAHYKFLGWSKNSSATTASFKKGDSYTAIGTMDFYAVWERIVYQIGLHYNYSGSPSEIELTANSGDEFYFSRHPISRAGYTQTSWTEYRDGSGVSHTVNGHYTVLKSQTWYAQWRVNSYSVYFNANGGTFENGQEQKGIIQNYGTTVSLADYAPEQTGYVLAGWDTDPNTNPNAIDYDKYGTYTVSGNATLYAIWRQAHTVTYHANGGLFENGQDSVIDYDLNTGERKYYYNGEYVTVKTANELHLANGGYQFYGWATSPTGRTAYFPGTESDEFQIYGSTHLYAIWKILRFTWLGSDGADSAAFVSGALVSDAIKAKAWNNLWSYLNRLRSKQDQEAAEVSFAASGDEIKASDFNDLAMKLTQTTGVTSAPSLVGWKSVIYPGQFNGSYGGRSSLKKALNDAIDAYNNSL